MGDDGSSIISMPHAVVAGDDQPKIAEAKKTSPSAPKWETSARERLKTVIRRAAKPLADLVTRDANEGDTRILVTEILTDGLGFDKYEDLTTEYQVKGEFADYGVRLDKQLIAFVEVKRATTKLQPKHLRQVEMYAVNEGVEWVILTNGAHWQVYHIGMAAGAPVQIDLAIDTNLLGEETVGAKSGHLFFVTKEALRRKLIDALWKEKLATSPKSLAKIIGSDAVINAIRKELRRRSGHNVDEKEIARLVKSTVLREDCL